MRSIWNYRFYALAIIGQILTWYNVTDTWGNNTRFILLLLGILITHIGVVLQIIFEPNYKVKCPDCNAELVSKNGKITFKKHCI